MLQPAQPAQAENKNTQEDFDEQKQFKVNMVYLF